MSTLIIENWIIITIIIIINRSHCHWMCLMHDNNFPFVLPTKYYLPTAKLPILDAPQA